MHILKFAVVLGLAAQSMVSHAAETGNGYDRRIEPDPLISDRAVVQRNRPIRIWGRAEPGSEVAVSFDNEMQRARSDSGGRWRVEFGPRPAGGPYELRLSGHGDVIVRDILVGEVWLCSGQSNMQWPVFRSKGGDQASRQVTNDNLRLLTVPQRIALTPAAVNQTLVWRSAGAESIRDFSAVCYFFGRALQKRLKVPVGLVHASWGGTRIEAWMRESTLRQMGAVPAEIADLARYRRDPSRAQDEHRQRQAIWWRANDPGSAAEPPWSAPEHDAADWATVQVPSCCDDAVLPGFDGTVWYRREFHLPDGYDRRNAVLSLAKIDDADTTWLNGVEVGATDGHDVRRRYPVRELLRSGRNIIAIRVLDLRGRGGIYGPPEAVALTNPVGQVVPLAGEWQYRTGRSVREMDQPLRSPVHKNSPGVLFNGMIAGLTPFAFQGVVWYQGEENAYEPASYLSRLLAFKRDWRDAFGSALFFNVVQLANFDSGRLALPADAWPLIREAQRRATDLDRRSALAVTIDIGDAEDIHPANKLDVGLRLATNALAVVYGIETGSPAKVSLTATLQEDGVVLVRLAGLKGELVNRCSEDQLLIEICASDHHCSPADVSIDEDSMRIVAGDAVAPTFVRYGWRDNPAACLFDGQGLPVGPFRLAVAI